MGGQFVAACTKALPLILAPPAKKGKQGTASIMFFMDCTEGHHCCLHFCDLALVFRV
jgi:hypothetical protein